MSRQVLLPPENGRLPNGTRLGGWWHDDPAESGRIVCDLCPRDCHLRPGDRGFCFVRENRDGQMVLSTYGRSTGFCIDPIEKKPLNHFYPGTSVLSFGTAGCNLGCKFCQNWSISKSREIEQLSESATPEAIASAALKLNCQSVAFTYNDPVVWAEYAIDTAAACRAAGVKTVAVTAGYITPQARPAFYEQIDAANVDLKGFTESFYKHLTLSHLEPVKETLRWLVHESPVWTEITNLIIPRENDSPDELAAMCDWIAEALGPNVPVHFTAFHPDFRLMDRERTPTETLLRAYEIASQRGLNYVYAGNIQSRPQQATYCPGCKRPVVGRVGYTIERYELRENKCLHCGTTIHGHFAAAPGDWGSRRQPVRIRDFEVKPRAELQVVAGPEASMSAPLPQLPPSPSPPIAAAGKAVEQPFTATQQQAILQSVVHILAATVYGRSAPPVAEPLGATGERSVLGAFVSVKRSGRLRSCCGFLGQTVPLAQALVHAAQRTAGDDHRFPPLAPRELPYLDLEVWLLSNQQRVRTSPAERGAAIQIGKHGLTIARGSARGLLLPGVAVEHGLAAEEFLEHVCLKAQLPPTAWRESDTELWTFEGDALRGAIGDFLPQESSDASSLPVTSYDLPSLAEFCRGNLEQLMSGGTPNYFASGTSDGTVSGVALSLLESSGEVVGQAHRLSLRSGLPIQSTLFSLAESLAQSLQRQGYSPRQLASKRVAVTLLADPALQGTLAEPDLQGIDSARQALVVLERNRSAVLFDPARQPPEMLREVADFIQPTAPQSAQIYSLIALTALPQLRVVQRPTPAHGASVRPAAMAGKFYPADPGELAKLVDRCLPEQPVARADWPAVMVPHAGLVYSGRIAADVWRRIRIPSTVIVIGPKHTPYGVDWAVAPHQTWSLPGATLLNDLDLAQLLVAGIPGLQFDAAAHAQEHAIEVELPFLARLAPETKVVGIAIGAGDLARCRQFAAGLAPVLRTLPEQPLLAISSDMNHFASDAENRRLDAIALAAMETLDPEQLYGEVTSRHISMCGLLPAVIVMETLRQLGQLSTVQRCGYATSAEVTGDRSRVVGYAGMLLGR